MGGAWKGCPYMLERFAYHVHKAYPNAKIEKPIFEPVLGCVVLRCMRDGLDNADTYAQIRENFADYLYERQEMEKYDERNSKLL